MICYSRECWGFELIYTNLSHEFLLSFVWMKFLRFRRSHDMRGIKETQELKLGDAQGIPSSYSKKSQSTKLGDAQGIPPFFFNNYRSVLVEPKFLLLHMICAILGVSFYFHFVCCLNKILGSEIFIWRESSHSYLIVWLLIWSSLISFGVVCHSFSCFTYILRENVWMNWIS